jgi:hypothetical protein
MVDRYTKVVLTVIAVALVVVTARPFLEPRPAQAQGPVDVRVVGWTVPGNVKVRVDDWTVPSISVSASFGGPLQVDCVSGCRSR